MPARRTSFAHALRAALALAALLLAAGPSAARHGEDDHGFDDHGFDDDGFDDHGFHHHGRRGRHGRHHGDHFGHRNEGAWWGDFRGGAEFEALVVGVDTSARLLILESGEALFVPVDTPFHPEGDLFSFEAVVDLATAGFAIELEGIATPARDGVWVATAIKAEDDR